MESVKMQNKSVPPDFTSQVKTRITYAFRYMFLLAGLQLKAHTLLVPFWHLLFFLFFLHPFLSFSLQIRLFLPNPFFALSLLCPIRPQMKILLPNKNESTTDQH